MTKIARTKITKDEDGEFRVKAYDANGKRMKSADYFTDDRDDAEGTAAAMVNTNAASEAEPKPTFGELARSSVGINAGLNRETTRAELLSLLDYYRQPIDPRTLDEVHVEVLLAVIDEEFNEFAGDGRSVKASQAIKATIENVAAELNAKRPLGVNAIEV